MASDDFLYMQRLLNMQHMYKLTKQFALQFPVKRFNTQEHEKYTVLFAERNFSPTGNKRNLLSRSIKKLLNEFEL